MRTPLMVEAATAGKSSTEAPWQLEKEVRQ